MPDSAPEVIDGRYEIQRELGRGGMATVFLARDLRHERLVALKLIAPAWSARGAGRFLREIRLTATLQHPLIVPLLDSGESPAGLWYAMPYVEGESLRQRLRRTGALPVEEALRLTKELAGALGHAHARGVLHRDVKPENILLSGGHALLADFGIAALLAGPGAERLTDSGAAIGTPAYMSPEQLDAEPAIDARSDLYALATVLYEMLAGTPPYPGPTAQAIIARRFRNPVPSIRVARAEVPETVDRAIARALATEPEERFASVADFVAALAGAPTAPARRRRPRWPAFVLVAALAMAGGAILLRNRPAPPAGDDRSIAVLPFVPLASDSASIYFADGMTDEITTALGRTAGIRVADPAAAKTYAARGATAREIGAALHVAYVLEGDLRRDGAQLRVSAKLVNARDGLVAWTRRVDRDVQDVFTTQDSVTALVVRELSGTLGAVAPLAGDRPRSVAAYELVLRARYFRDRRREADMRKALQLYAQAAALDSTYAAPYIGIAETLGLLEDDYMAPSEAGPLMEAALSRALTLQPNAVEALARQAEQLGLSGYRWDEAFAVVRQAWTLDSTSHYVQYMRGLLEWRQGRYETALSLLRSAESDNPLSVARRTELGALLTAMGRFREAGATIDSVLEIAPDYDDAAFHLADNWFAQGNPAKALSTLQRVRDPDARIRASMAVAEARLGHVAAAERVRDSLEAESRQHYVAPDYLGWIEANLGHSDAAFRWLDSAYVRRSSWLADLRFNQQLTPLHDDPRFAVMARRVGVAQAEAR